MFVLVNKKGEEMDMDKISLDFMIDNDEEFFKMLDEFFSKGDDKD